MRMACVAAVLHALHHGFLKWRKVSSDSTMGGSLMEDVMLLPVASCMHTMFLVRDFGVLWPE
jgi:hypothetical protein